MIGKVIINIVIIVGLLVYSQKKASKANKVYKLGEENKTEEKKTEEKKTENHYVYNEKEKEQFKLKHLELEKIKMISDELENITNRIENLKYNLDTTFYPYQYTPEKARRVEKHLVEYYLYQKRIFNILRENDYFYYDDIPQDLRYYSDEYYYYNLVQCYLALNNFIKVNELLNECFEIAELCSSNNNIVQTYISFLRKLLEKKQLELLIQNLDNDDRLNYLNEKEIEDFVYLLAEKSMDKKFLVDFSKALSNHQIKSNGLVQILRMTDIELKVYFEINQAETSYKNKEYEKAKEYIELAIENAKFYDEDIDFAQELYGDICYKLKDYNLALNSYNLALLDNSYDYRIFCKIGDCYARLKDLDSALKYFFFSIYTNKEYKTVQVKFINTCKKLNLDYTIEDIQEILKKYNSMSKEEVFSYGIINKVEI